MDGDGVDGVRNLERKEGHYYDYQSAHFFWGHKLSKLCTVRAPAEVNTKDTVIGTHSLKMSDCAQLRWRSCML